VALTDDTKDALRSAVALVNSAVEPDTLTTVCALDKFFVGHRYSGRHDRTRAELDEVRRIRPLLRELLLAARDEAAELANRMLAESGLTPQLVRHDGQDWHLHAWAPDQPFAARICAETALAMTDLIRADELSRLGACADPDCDGIALDLTRNRSRRFCSTQCSNRAAVGAYRARRARAGGTAP